ncbi:MAG: hypothetical protein WB818_14540, partial [Desulfobacterales bacterium]
ALPGVIFGIHFFPETDIGLNALRHRERIGFGFRAPAETWENGEGHHQVTCYEKPLHRLPYRKNFNALRVREKIRRNFRR